MKSSPASLVEILKWRAENQPHDLAYRFLIDGEKEGVCINYRDLDRRACSIGAILQTFTKPGDRAILLFPPGLEFIAAYFGCFYANIIAVPTFPPHPLRLEKTLTSTFQIISDAQPAVALMPSALYNAINAQFTVKQKFESIRFLVTDNKEMDSWADNWKQPFISGDDIAFLQYTSGSTSSPRGVMVSHDNLISNLELIKMAIGNNSNSHGVIWLPHYHDMGLIGGILEPLYAGFPVSLMPHLAFLQNPMRWLSAISRFRATTSASPNFGFDLCVRKIKPEDRENLDLSSWEIVFNGAEPINYDSLDQFARYFAPRGFRRETFAPCYGLAESTLLATCTPTSSTPIIKKVDRSALGENKIRVNLEPGAGSKAIVSCGKNLDNQKIRIVNPETLEVCPPNEVGEIWLNSPSVAKGYWNNPEATASTFEAHLPGNNEETFLRTGDLGFIYEEEVFVTGRLKNLIIIDGRNYYPSDI